MAAQPGPCKCGKTCQNMAWLALFTHKFSPEKCAFGQNCGDTCAGNYCPCACGGCDESPCNCGNNCKCTLGNGCCERTTCRKCSKFVVMSVCLFVYIYIYIYIYTNKHTLCFLYIYIYIYKKQKPRIVCFKCIARLEDTSQRTVQKPCFAMDRGDRAADQENCCCEEKWKDIQSRTFSWTQVAQEQL